MAGTWRIPYRGGALELGRRTLVMGILNVTPGSFSNGGRYVDVGAAVARAWEMVAEGADIVDVGGESTRPGHTPVPVEEEMARVLPVIRRLVAEGFPVPISVDTMKARVAEAALDEGAVLINDVWGLQRDPDMAKVAARYGAPVVAMHNKPHTHYRDLMGDIIAYLRRSIEVAVAAGLPEEAIIVDPGIGFGKTAAQSVQVERELARLKELGGPILVGTSRKSHIGHVLGGLPPDQRLEGTAATVALCIAGGADIVRVHDVQAMVRVARMADAIVQGWEPSAIGS